MTAAAAPALVRLESTPDLVDRVYRALVEAISTGTLAPGARFTQEEMAERLAVSRQPVLQAVRLLKRDGLVVDAPGRGVLVKPLDAESIAHVYQVRGALDALAARLAAERRAILPEHLVADGRRAAAGHDVNAMIEADIAFHNAIYAAAGNPLLAESARLHWCHIRRAMGAVLRDSAQRATLWDEHAAIAQAIVDGDGARAEALSRQHGQAASDNMTRHLQGVHHPQETLDETHPGAARAVRA